jgi:hypothetical protein
MKNVLIFITSFIYMIILMFSLTVLFGCGTDGALAIKQIPGPQGEQGEKGDTGAVGAQGESGLPGQDGSSCTTFNVSGGAVISCTDGSYSIVSDGKDGSTIELLNPCGDLDRHDEIFLRFMASDGMLTVVAFFTDNGSALFSRLSVLRCDDTTIYRTTEKDSCIFKLTTACELSYDINI